MSRPWKHPRPGWTDQSGLVEDVPHCRGVEWSDLERSHPTPTILWFYNSIGSLNVLFFQKAGSCGFSFPPFTLSLTTHHCLAYSAAETAPGHGGAAAAPSPGGLGQHMESTVSQSPCRDCGAQGHSGQRCHLLGLCRSCQLPAAGKSCLLLLLGWGWKIQASRQGCFKISLEKRGFRKLGKEKESWT